MSMNLAPEKFSYSPEYLRWRALTFALPRR